MTLLCLNCKHAGTTERGPRYWLCLSPQNVTMSRMDGMPEPRYLYCHTHRNDGLPDSCGPEGRWFVPKASARDE